MEKDNDSKDDEKIELDNSSNNSDDDKILPQKDNKKDNKLTKSSKNINLEQSQESQTFDITHQNQEQLSAQQNDNFTQRKQSKVQKKKRVENSKKKSETVNSKDANAKKKQSNKNENSDAAKSKKFLNHANMIVNSSVKFDKEKNPMENVLSNADNAMISEAKYFAKEKVVEKVDKFSVQKASKNLASFGKAGGKVLEKVNVAGSAINTVSETFNNPQNATKNAIGSAATGDPTKIIALVCIFFLFAIVGLFSVMGSNSSQSKNLRSANNYNNYNYVKSVANFEFGDDDEDTESMNNTSAIKNLNQIYLQLNNFFYGYDGDENASLLDKLKKNLLDQTNIECDVFSDYVMDYFKDEIDDNKLKKNIKTYVKKNNLFFNESVGVTNYNTFKNELDTVYKTKFKQIQKKVINESPEEESYSNIMQKVESEFKNYFSSNHILSLSCYKWKIPWQSDDTGINITYKSLEKISKSAELFRDLTKKIIVNTDMEYDIFDDYAISYFFGEKSDDQLIGKIKRDFINKNLIFNESIGDKNYNTFKNELDNYKLRFQEIKANVDKETDDEVDDETIYREKIINEFKNDFADDHILKLPCYKPIDVDEKNLKIVEKFGTAYEPWKDSKELIGMLYFISNVNDIPEDRKLNITSYNLNKILDSLSNEMTYVDASLVWEKNNGQEDKITYIYGNESKNTSLLLERELLNTYNNIYRSFIDKISGSETENEDFDDNTMLKNLSIFKEEVEKLSDKGNVVNFYILNPSEPTRLSQSYNAFVSQTAEIFGVSEYSAASSEDYSRKVDDILYGIPEIDLTQFDKSIYFSSSGVNKIEAKNKINTMIEFIQDFRKKIINAQNDNNENIKKVNEALQNIEDGESKKAEGNYIYDDTTVDDLPGLDEFKIVIDDRKYFLIDDISAIKNISIDYDSENFEAWLRDSDFYDKFFSDSSVYNLGDEYDNFKDLLYEGMQTFEPILNQRWEEKLLKNFGENIVYKENEREITFDQIESDVPFELVESDHIELNVDRYKDIYAICSGTVVEDTGNSIKIKCKTNSELQDLPNKETLFDEDVDFYVEYTNLYSTVSKANVFRYEVPTEDSVEIKESDVIGKSKGTVKIKCYLVEKDKDGNDKQVLLNPLLLMQGDDGLPEEAYIPPTPTPIPTPTPTPTSTSTPIPSFVPTPTSTLEPSFVPTPTPRVLHASLLLVFATIVYYVGMLYAIWAIIKFALGLNDYESVNYQAIWQFVAASILIMGALLLKYISGLN